MEGIRTEEGGREGSGGGEEGREEGGVEGRMGERREGGMRVVEIGG